MFFVAVVAGGKGLGRFDVRGAKAWLADAPEDALGGLWSPFMPRDACSAAP
jgi:hypothetical protein